jgi:predicted Zn-dependent protease
MLTINETLHSEEELIDIIWEAFSHFPTGIWEEVHFLGNIEAQHHLKITSNEETYGAFTVDKLLKAVRALRMKFEVEGLLLVLTGDPVVITFYRVEPYGFKMRVSLVHDYVNTKVGIVSLFEIDEETAVKVTAHGMGHNRGLGHHEEPIDLMYARLLNGSQTENDCFCDECRKKLESLVHY